MPLKRGVLNMIINLNKNQEIDSAIYPKKRWDQGAISDYVLKSMSEFYQDFLDVVPYNHWKDFAIKFKDYKLNETTIFRGQSNSLSNRELDFWEINSSFNRSPYKTMNLSDYLLNLARATNEISKYGVDCIDDKNSNSVIDLMAFLQHKGIPTPLIDFTKDPITAFYFALSGIPPVMAHQPSDAFFHSVFELNLPVLIEHFNIQDLILKEDVTLFNVYDVLEDFKIPIEKGTNKDNLPIIAICSSDKQKYNLVNQNLVKQDGTFVFFYMPKSLYFKDLWDDRLEKRGKIKLFDNITFEKVINYINYQNGTSFKPIILHLIPYSSLAENSKDASNPYDLLYTYFKIKGKTGLNLFDDITGFKHDFLFNAFYNFSRVNMSHPNIDAELKAKLISRGVINE
jgi:hypothetical protein